jgi:hypothetical protein
MLDEFRTVLMHIYKFNSVDSIQHKPSPIVTPPITVPNISTSLPSQSPVDLFKCSIKQDFVPFPTLKDDKHNDQRHCTLISIAQAQDLSDILDRNKPVTPVEIDLFAEKQKFMYAVLEAKVETAKCKSILHTYETSYDAQKAYAILRTTTLRLIVPLLVQIRLWSILYQLGSMMDCGMVL